MTKKIEKIKEVAKNRKKYFELTKYRKWIDIPNEVKPKILELRSIIKEKAMIRVKLPTKEIDKSRVWIKYFRYADDFIIFTNGNKKHGLFIKENIKQWLKDNLKLNLSIEKTRITKLSHKAAKFLGFDLHTYTFRKIEKSYKYGDYVKKAGWNIIVNIDMQRVMDRMKLKKFLNLKGKPIGKTSWIVFRPEEIINKYNAIIRGIVNYYGFMISRKHRLNSILYFLKFSCLSTLARKFNISRIQLKKKYGDPITITIQEKSKKTRYDVEKDEIIEKEKSFTLLTYKEVRRLEISEKASEAYRKRVESYNNIYADGDIFDVITKINWRTYRNLTNECVIGGTTENVQMHHIKHVRRGKVIGFSQILKQLNRRMIPLCETHHRDVHKGKYDGIKLNELYGLDRFILSFNV